QHIDARGRDGREAREQLDETGQFPACGFGGTAYSSAGGEQSVTKTSTWRKDQRAGLSGASKPHSTAASTRTYASEPRPRCWRRCALGLSQYRPMPASQVTTRPNRRYARQCMLIELVGRRNVRMRQLS